MSQTIKNNYQALPRRWHLCITQGNSILCQALHSNLTNMPTIQLAMPKNEICKKVSLFERNVFVAF